MLQVQVEYWKQGEEVRHDQEMEHLEAEKQKETQRANLAGEAHRSAELEETKRHAVESERIANWQTQIQATNAESQRISAEAARMQAENSRISANAAARSAEAAVMNAQASQVQAQAAQQQARTAAYNAETQRLNYQEQATQNIRSNNLRNKEIASNVMIAGYTTKQKEEAAQLNSATNVAGAVISAFGRLVAAVAK